MQKECKEGMAQHGQPKIARINLFSVFVHLNRFCLSISSLFNKLKVTSHTGHFGGGVGVSQKVTKSDEGQPI